MAQLFQRSCVVIVDTLRIEGLRVQFKVTKTQTKDPNSCEIKIYNLSKNSRAQIQKKYAKISLAAGYGSNSAVIFSGDARTADHVRDGPDWITHIQCGDGERAYRLARLPANFTFRAGTPIATVIKAAANALGVNTGNLDAQLAAGNFTGGLTQYTHGYAAHGRASAELDRLLRTVGLKWSVQDGALSILRDGESLPGQAVLLSPDTGLVGSPDHGTPDQKGLPAVTKAKSLLQPLIKLGGKVNIQSESTKGQFRVQKLEHTGDTAAGEWYTSIEAVLG